MVGYVLLPISAEFSSPYSLVRPSALSYRCSPISLRHVIWRSTTENPVDTSHHIDKCWHSLLQSRRCNLHLSPCSYEIKHHVLKPERTHIAKKDSKSGTKSEEQTKAGDRDNLRLLLLRISTLSALRYFIIRQVTLRKLSFDSTVSQGRQKENVPGERWFAPSNTCPVQENGRLEPVPRCYSKLTVKDHLRRRAVRFIYETWRIQTRSCEKKIRITRTSTSQGEGADSGNLAASIKEAVMERVAIAADMFEAQREALYLPAHSLLAARPRLSPISLRSTIPLSNTLFRSVLDRKRYLAPSRPPAHALSAWLAPSTSRRCFPSRNYKNHIPCHAPFASRPFPPMWSPTLCHPHVPVASHPSMINSLTLASVKNDLIYARTILCWG